MILALVCAARAGTPDVPLDLWRGPGGVGDFTFDSTNGISAGDVDGDGWVDAFAWASGILWYNVDGVTWTKTDLNDIASGGQFAGRYGSSLADFDRDGFAEISTEPYGTDDCVDLFDTADGVTWVNIKDRFDVPVCGQTETQAWADVDGDGWLDLFVPVYPYTGPGNGFYHSNGPGLDGLITFTEMADAAGFVNPDITTRPEGVQFVDIDDDGDADLYSNGLLYQNQTVVGGPVTFQFLQPVDAGIGNVDILDEGAAFGDFDLDGDFDLAVAYVSDPGFVIYLQRGDGTFVESTGVVEPVGPILTSLGLSIEDWDHDGDLDITTMNIFHKNMLVETGETRLEFADVDIRGDHIGAATPAWVDWDHDGDLDAYLSDWQSEGHLYVNSTWDADSPKSEVRTVRVRPVSDEPGFPNGLQTEFGARVEITVHGDPTGRRYRRFVASGSGYLNQNEYTLTFTLPPDPTPDDDATDLVFDVAVDFLSRPEDGKWRVDASVNPALGGISLADLDDRDIVVFHSGLARVDGADTAPVESPQLFTAGGGLTLADRGAALPEPTAVAAQWVGVEFTTDGPTRLREILVDGTPSAAVTCGADTGNVMVWDVTDPSAPARVAGAAWTLPAREGNHRHSGFVDAALPEGRVYRAVMRVDAVRANAITAPTAGPVTLAGGLVVTAADPCDGAAIAAATVDPAQLHATVRYSAIADAGTTTTGPDTADTGGGGTTTPTTDGTATDTGAGGGDKDSGCGCSTTGAPPWIALLAALLVIRRRSA